ncbi:MAG: hypothetical protein WCW36_02375 [Candidatus Paceibacterota bacterium]|jgi:hypothetical protein
MKKTVLAIMATSMMFAGSVSAHVTGDIGVYTSYVNGSGTVLDNLPVAQGQITYTFDNGAYVNGWFSQSLREPGLDNTLGNEIDAKVGWDGRVSEKFSADFHVAYFDLANTKLLNCIDGDMIDVGGKLRFHATETTSFYTHADTYYGLGPKGFDDSWKVGLGVRTEMLGATTDLSVYHVEKPDASGEFLKLSLEPNAVGHIMGCEIRSISTAWFPLGSYNDTHEVRIMTGFRMNW